MAWWGKLVGGALGFMVGGPIGALLGAGFGHNFDSKSRQRQKRLGYSPGDQERTQAAFFAATFSVMGHVAKADGRVSKSEIDLANQLMTHMQLNPQQKEMAISLFNPGQGTRFSTRRRVAAIQTRMSPSHDIDPHVSGDSGPGCHGRWPPGQV